MYTYLGEPVELIRPGKERSVLTVRVRYTSGNDEICAKAMSGFASLFAEKPLGGTELGQWDASSYYYQYETDTLFALWVQWGEAARLMGFVSSCIVE